MDYLMSVLVLVISFKIIIAIALSSAFLKRLVLRASRWALGVLARLTPPSPIPHTRLHIHSLL